jgi:hypothetical protein
MKFGLFYLPTYLPEIRDVQTHYRGIIERQRRAAARARPVTQP